MRKIIAEEGKIFVWAERKVIAKVIYTPDNFSPSVLKSVSEAEAKALEARWEAEAQAEAEAEGDLK